MYPIHAQADPDWHMDVPTGEWWDESSTQSSPVALLAEPPTGGDSFVPVPDLGDSDLFLPSWPFSPESDPVLFGYPCATDEYLPRMDLSPTESICPLGAGNLLSRSGCQFLASPLHGIEASPEPLSQSTDWPRQRLSYGASIGEAENAMSEEATSPQTQAGLSTKPVARNAEITQLPMTPLPTPPTSPVRRVTSANGSRADSASGESDRDSTFKLRTWSRPKKSVQATKKARSAESDEKRNARTSHNQVEKKYRSRLNTQFELLLAALPQPGADDGTCGSGDAACTVSKAKVLDRARRRIRALERENETLRRETR